MSPRMLCSRSVAIRRCVHCVPRDRRLLCGLQQQPALELHPDSYLGSTSLYGLSGSAGHRQLFSKGVLGCGDGYALRVFCVGDGDLLADAEHRIDVVDVRFLICFYRY